MIEMVAKNKKLIIYYLANKYNLPLSKVEQIINHQFKYIEKIMKEGKFESIRLPYFGKFSVNPNRVKHINKKNKNEK
jgi:nucleoid DNA-binding protein